MRLVASFLLCAAASLAGAAEIYRWKDANGVTHYTDFPVPGAERVHVAVAPPSQSDAPPPESIILPTEISPETPSRPFSYLRCTVTAPQNDQTFFGVQPVAIQLQLEPALQSGHRVQVFVNGAQRTDWPANATSYTLAEVFRGSHTLNARVLDATGRTVCNGPSITFHLRQQSVLPPANQPPRPAPLPAPRPPGPPAPAPGA